MVKLDLVAFAAKNAPGFNADKARADDRRALWTYTLLDAQGHGAVVRPEDRDRMIAKGFSEADIEAVKRHLAMLRANDMVPTKYHVLRQMIEGVQAAPTAGCGSKTRGWWSASCSRRTIHRRRPCRQPALSLFALTMHRGTKRRRSRNSFPWPISCSSRSAWPSRMPPTITGMRKRSGRPGAAPLRSSNSWSRISASRKGFEVCRLRDIPIIAIINKIDPEGLDPLALLDEIASGLALDLTVLTWPIGMGVDLTKLLFVHANLGRQTRQFESVAATQLTHEMTEHGSRLAHLRSSRGHGRADGRSLR
ncbi:hypothetical protein [Bradyrhizobium symbiodeficiens]|uniref:hypothetical protein n=1 Tax=Bradyrhizobium symbiodeficiens TaxID=1404367 RepID=UPI003BAEF1CC